MKENKSINLRVNINKTRSVLLLFKILIFGIIYAFFNEQIRKKNVEYALNFSNPIS